MKHVVAPAIVAHLWAHQTQDHARNSGGNFYFDDNSIYSYGSHFRCASVVENRDGEKAYLVTTRTYSNTTAKHMGMVRGAIPYDSQVFHTPRAVNLERGRLSQYDYEEALYYIVDMLKTIDESIQSQKSSRTRNYTNIVEDTLLNIGRWIKFWGLDKRQKGTHDEWFSPALTKLTSTKKDDKKHFWKVREVYSRYSSYSWHDEVGLQKLLILINEAGLIQNTAISGFEQRVIQLFKQWSGDEQIWEKFRVRHEKQAEINRKSAETRERNEAIKAEQRRKEYEEQDRIRRMSFEEKQEKWRSGEIKGTWIDIPFSYPFNSILRVHNGMIETSKGITVSPKEAIRVWPLIKRFHSNEASFQGDFIRDSNDHPWAINSYNNDIMTAGCHRISYEEMKNCISQLGIAV